jgi:hypothetical protein
VVSLPLCPFVGDWISSFIPGGGGTLFTQSYTATFSPVAALSRAITKSLTATLSFIGVTTKKYLDAGFAATLSFVGNLAVSKTFLRALTATLSFTGALSRRTGKALSATLTLTAAQTKRIVDSGFSATLSFVGALTKNTRKNLNAALSFVGNLAISKVFVRAFSATLSFVGNLAQSFIAGGGHVFTQSYAATMSFVGAFTKLPQKAFAANFGTSGLLIRKYLDAGFTATLSFVGNLAIGKASRGVHRNVILRRRLQRIKSFLKVFTATLVHRRLKPACRQSVQCHCLVSVLRATSRARSPQR